MNRGDFLILSGAHISAELLAEFGTLPPAFLPFGNKRLYEHQIAFASTVASRIFMTLPCNYQIPESDLQFFENNNIIIIKSDPDATLADALNSALFDIKPDNILHILHGDTIVSLPKEHRDADIFACGSTSHYAIWAIYKTNAAGTVSFEETLGKTTDPSKTICGYFCFTDGSLYHQTISESKTFIDSLNSYNNQRCLRPVEVDFWLDFGHLHTYFYSRQKDLLTRDFNSLRTTPHSVKKKGLPPRKIYAEALWFNSAPTVLKPFLPQLYGINIEEEVEYEIEYLFLTSLSELFVFGNLPPSIWRAILTSCMDFIICLHSLHPKTAEIPTDFHKIFYEDMIVTKSYERCEKFIFLRNISPDQEWKINGNLMPSLRRVIEMMLEIIRPTAKHDISFWHGDFHFANIMFDFRSQRIKTIDPRGMLADGTLTLWGDRRYDIAKLTHSVIGLYDFITAERFNFGAASNNIELSFPTHFQVRDIQAEYNSILSEKLNISSREVLAITALLFLSMLPLHSESRERQNVILANGLRLAHMAEIEK